MRKLKIFEHISLDGVIQAPGGPNEDGNYPYGGWTLPYRDPAAGKVVLAAHSEPFDLLLGRRTYDIWSGFWPKAPSSPLADSLNAATKYGFISKFAARGAEAQLSCEGEGTARQR
jgi:dihydrofolate reductase